MCSESYIERTVCKAARSNGWLVFKFTGQAGVPDRLFAKDGRVVFVEFKAPGGKLRKLQQVTMDKMRNAGLEVHVIDSIETTLFN